MVAVVQLVEHQVVILAVAGSSPVSHPRYNTASPAIMRVGRCSFHGPCNRYAGQLDASIPVMKFDSPPVSRLSRRDR